MSAPLVMTNATASLSQAAQNTLNSLQFIPAESIGDIVNLCGSMHTNGVPPDIARSALGAWARKTKPEVTDGDIGALWAQSASTPAVAAMEPEPVFILDSPAAAAVLAKQVATASSTAMGTSMPTTTVRWRIGIRPNPTWRSRHCCRWRSVCPSRMPKASECSIAPAEAKRPAYISDSVDQELLL